jgi:hypothetical protein
MFGFATSPAPTARRTAARFLPALSFSRVLEMVVEADRRYRETRRLERLDYPHLRDMGIDLGRTRTGIRG